MMMNLDFALDDLPTNVDAGDVRAALTESRAAGAKLFRMIANLLDIARSDDGRLQPKRSVVDVGALFLRVIEEHSAEAQARKVSVSSRVALEKAVEVDPDILGRVLANLVENALRYTYAGGTIVLTAQLVGAGPNVELTVANDGRPIAPELRAFIFEKYAQVASSQSINRGLGLYFCRVAVEAHGGRIELVNEPSAATCFRIELPQA
jgi:signal transduction histidine kinase